jgi:hypothetical protein
VKLFKIKPSAGTCLCIISLFFFQLSAQSQTLHQEKMLDLRFIVGDWVGVSRKFKNDSIISEVPAYENIRFSVDTNIITIDLESETLKLHTVIYYDDKEQQYVYNVFYINGAGKYPANIKDGKLVVTPREGKRFIFHAPAPGEFQEYGEELIDGKWVKYFEDTFKRASDK